MKNREWKTFSLGDEKYFTLHATLNGIDKNKLIDNGEKKYPYITRSKNNNGLDMFVSEQPQDINKGNVIIIGLDTQTVFYQESDFYTGQNVQILYNEHLTKNIAFFLIPIIKKQLAVLNWGGNGATLGRLKKKKVVLPVNDEGTPDWGFMEEYIREKSNQINDTYKLPEFHEISDERELNELEWQPFLISDYFVVNKERGNESNMDALPKGNLPLISAKKMGNGLKGFVTTDEKKIKSANVITWNKDGDGGAGLAYYQEFKFAVDSHVFVLYAKFDANKYSQLFISRILSKYKEIFNHGRANSLVRFKSEKFMLPSKNNQPDFEFMEQYMKRMENKVISKIRKL
ncbi:restriction endonuclease subunit S [Rummeliibacillus pycnus]|uniref:restriction endonuclease subunit S n=1 Tax=Rummeliibacillus pycnus TaxID=101070 RepID=UPI0037CC367A